MKALYTLMLLLVLSAPIEGKAQTNSNSENPLFSLLSGIKNSSEFLLRKHFMQQDLELATIISEPTSKKNLEKKRLENFKASSDIIIAYNNLKIETDQLITQLKADLTISNKKKQLKKLNTGSNEHPWYKAKLESVQKKYNALLSAVEGKSFALGIEVITGAFTAVADVVGSARDFRALQITALCVQLDALRLKDFSELSSPAKSESKEEEE